MTYKLVYNPNWSKEPRRSLRWMGSSLNDLRRCSADVRRAIGFELDALQRGVDPEDWKPMSTVGLGVCEVRVHIGGEHRVLYVTRFADAVHVLHVFQKKSRRATARDLELGRVRYRLALQRHMNRKDEI